MNTFHQIYSPYTQSNIKHLIPYNDRNEPAIFFNSLHTPNDISVLFLHQSTALIIWDTDIHTFFQPNNMKLIQKLRSKPNTYHLVAFPHHSTILSKYIIDHHFIPIYRDIYPKYTQEQLQSYHNSKQSTVKKILQNYDKNKHVYILDTLPIDIIKQHPNLQFIINTANPYKQELLKHKLSNVYEQIVRDPISHLPNNTLIATLSNPQNMTFQMVYTIFQLGQLNIPTYCFQKEHNQDENIPYFIYGKFEEYIENPTKIAINRGSLNRLQMTDEVELDWLSPMNYEGGFYTKRSEVHLVHYEDKIKVEYIPEMSNMNGGVYQHCIVSKNTTYLIRIKGYKEIGCNVNLWIATPGQQTILFTPEYCLPSTPGTLQYLYDNKLYEEIIIGLMFHGINKYDQPICFFIQEFDVIPM